MDDREKVKQAMKELTAIETDEAVAAAVPALVSLYVGVREEALAKGVDIKEAHDLAKAVTLQTLATCK